MKISVILVNGENKTVKYEDALQFMIVTKKIHSFKRSDGWVIIGRDKIRKNFRTYKGSNRRRASIFSKVCWNCL